MTHGPALEESSVKKQIAKDQDRPKDRPAGGEMAAPGLAGLQKLVGNRAVQRLIAQRSGAGPTELDEDTAESIKRQRGSGQSLDSTFGAQAGEAMGADFSGVRVHTSREADSLSQQLGAKAFTTGQDMFFKQGTYDPHSSGGRELIAHELTHVVQQGSGAVPTGQRMAVTPAGDSFEQQADATATAVVTGGTASATAQQAPDEGNLQKQPTVEEEEETPAQTKRDAAALQMQPAADEEEEVPPAQTKLDAGALQRQPAAEEEEETPAQTKPDAAALQRQVPEEEEEEPPATQTKADTSALQMMANG